MLQNNYFSMANERVEENSLPPYWPFIRPNHGFKIHQASFDMFKGHQSLPFAMRRDFYELGDFSGTFQHTDFLALYAVRSGRGIHRIDNHPYGIVKGDVYLMAVGATHEFNNFSNLEIDCFFFQIGLFHAEELAALREIPGFWQLFVGDENIEHRIHLAPEEWHKTDAEIDVMRNYWGDRSRAGALLLKHEFFHLLVSLAHLIGKADSPAAPTKERTLDSGMSEALRFCEENFAKPLSVPKLAARAFLSPGHFSELFLREVGMSPGAYIRRIRLEKARTLLRETNLPVSEIASRCGFRTPALFSRAFHNFYEDSPLQYRKRGK